MIRAFVVASLIILSSAAWGRTQDVLFITGANTVAVRLAVQALQQVEPTANAPVSSLSAALVDLNGDGSPELFVQMSGGLCGALGCSIRLFERGTTGWIKIGDWIANGVSVTDARDAGWQRLLLDRSRTWGYSSSGYQLLR